MPTTKINDINLYWEVNGQKGEPLVLVHGSWGDHHNWDSVVGELSKTFRVLTYDRRGHSKSERREVQGNMEEDVSDLIALVNHAGLAPSHIAGNSGGAAVALKAAARNSNLFQSLVVHEPPLFDLLQNSLDAAPYLQAVNGRIEAVTALIENKELEQAARLFVETIAFGPGTWEQLPSQIQQTFVYNAPTFLDETKDPENLYIDTNKLSHFNKPTLLTQGTQSPPFFIMVSDVLSKAIPHAKRRTFEGAGHVPHLSHPKEYVQVVKDFCLTTVG
jgi:pimeloyl-ACP methyl ester carboxylesterase